jgi:Na+-transporting NADH:ubiquinone oxidoreductase subunit C
MSFDPNKSRAYVVFFAVAVSGVFTAAIMALHVATAPIVERNERLLTERAIVELFRLGDVAQLSGEQVAELYDRRIRRATIAAGTPEEMEILLAYLQDLPAEAPGDPGDKSRLKAYGVPIRGVGFWAMIEGYLAVTPDAARTLGVVFLRHSETPGLGGRITEDEFRRWFRPGGPHENGLNVTPPPQGQPYVEIGPPVEKTAPQYDRHVDALTGATGTSNAVADFLNGDLARFRRAMAAEGLLPEVP